MNIEKQYLDLCAKVLSDGTEKKDRTGTGTKSLFGAMLTHNMSDGFPLLTTKKVFLRGIFEELMWFLRGETNIQSLVKKKVNIWVGDAYKKYYEYASKLKEPERHLHISDPEINAVRCLTKEEFIEKIKTDDWFAKKWGECGPIYGSQWRNWQGSGDTRIDQIKNLIDTLKTNPDSRRMLVSALNVGELDKMILPPCHYGFQVWTKELSFIEKWKIAEPIYDKPLALTRYDRDRTRVKDLFPLPGIPQKFPGFQAGRLLKPLSCTTIVFERWFRFPLISKQSH